MVAISALKRIEETLNPSVGRAKATINDQSVGRCDGHAIAAHWTFADGSTADGLTLSVSSPAALGGTVTVIDGAGDAAQAAFSV